MTGNSGLTKTEEFSYGERVSNFSFAKVDIIIPFHGQYHRVRNLVESILLHTKSNPYLITLVDDASPNTAFTQQLTRMAPVRVIRLAKQSGFGAALKAGYDGTKKPWLVFMHSDCLVNDHSWLQRLGESMLRLHQHGVGLVHSRTDNPVMDHSILKKTAQEQAGEDNIVTTNEPLPLICALTHRGLFDKIGGFIKPYPYAGYEDVELFYRMRKNQLRQAVCGKAWIQHHGSATINDVIQRDGKIKQIMESNYELCMKDIS